MKPVAGRLEDVLGEFAFVDDDVAADALEFELQGRLGHSPETGRLSFEALDPNPLGTLMKSQPGGERAFKALVGVTEAGGVVLHNIDSRGNTVALGGSRVSVLRFGCLTAISKVDLGQCEGTELSDVTAVFGQGLRWSGESPVAEMWESDDEGRTKSVTLRVEAQSPPEEIRLRQRRRLSIGLHWRVDGQHAARLISSGLSVTVSQDQPSDVEEILQPLLMVQDLMTIAFQSPVLPTEASASFIAGPAKCPMWDWRLCEARAFAVEDRPGSAPSPRFSLRDMDGVAGVGRWIEMCERSPRAVSAIRYHRPGGGSIQSRLLDVASAIEYWVASHRRLGRAWPRQGKTHAEALALHAGIPFRSLCRGRERDWANRFWQTYRDVKHDPSKAIDAQSTQVLTLVGTLLLEMVALNRCARSSAPARALASGVWASQLQTALASVL